MLALHGTLVNVLNRKNTLNYAIDPLTGSVSPIDMLGLAPLVVGVELAFYPELRNDSVSQKRLLICSSVVEPTSFG